MLTLVSPFIFDIVADDQILWYSLAVVFFGITLVS